MKCLKINKLKNSVIQDDCLNVLKRLPANSIPLIVTSPPYNLRNTTGQWGKYGNGKGKWTLSTYDTHKDNMPHKEYVAWQREFISQALRVLKEDGALFYNHKYRIQGGLLQERHDITNGFPLRQIIRWDRGTGHNYNRGYFLPKSENIYLFANSKFQINREFIKYGDVWSFSPEQNNPHPAPFPLELPKRCIEASGAKLVLDPFAGSGTTALAARELNRDFICIEISPNYCKSITQRLGKL